MSTESETKAASRYNPVMALDRSGVPFVHAPPFATTDKERASPPSGEATAKRSANEIQSTDASSRKKRRRKKAPKPEKDDVESPPVIRDSSPTSPTAVAPASLPQLRYPPAPTAPVPYFSPLLMARPQYPPATFIHPMYNPFISGYRLPYAFPPVSPPTFDPRVLPSPPRPPPPIPVPVSVAQQPPSQPLVLSPNPNSRTLGLPASLNTANERAADSGFVSDQTNQSSQGSSRQGPPKDGPSSSSQPMEESSQSPIREEEEEEEEQKQKQKAGENEKEKSEVPMTSESQPAPSASFLDATSLLFSATECHLATLQDEDGDTPLHLAVAQENAPLVSYLVSLISGAKMNLDIYNYLRQTPLHIAVLTNQPQLVLILVNGGANANLPDRLGRTCVHQAITMGNLASLQAIAQAKNPPPDLEIKNFDGFTALHIGTRSPNLPLVELLLRLGANINAKDGKSGMTPLHVAVESGSTEMIQFLLQNGALTNVANDGGSTALHMAVANHSVDVVRILLESGANARVSNVEGFTPIDLAASSTIKQLLRSGDKKKV